MKSAISHSLFAFLILAAAAVGHGAPNPLPDAPSQTTANGSGDTPDIGRRDGDAPSSSRASTSGSTQPAHTNTQGCGLADKFHYYLTETYFNPSALTVPAFHAGLHMANPPGKGATEYPPEWRQGAGAFGRNYGDAFAERVSFQSARFVTGVITGEDPGHISSSGHNGFARSIHALSFTLIDRSDSGHSMPALSNLVGAAAAGFVGNAYLPSGFNDVTHAGQRATIRFGFTASGNLFREFAPQMPGPLRTFILLIAR